MTTNDITLQQDKRLGKELDMIVLKNNLILNFMEIIQLPNLYFGMSNTNWLKQNEYEVKNEMKCEVQFINDEIKKLLIDVKIKMKKRYPIRYRLQFIKKIISNPFRILFYLLLIKKRKI